MRYTGSAAYAYDEAWEAAPGRADGQGRRAPLEVVEGGAPSREAARASSQALMARFRAFVAVVAVLAVVGLARVALTAATVAQLADNQATQAQAASLESDNMELETERSALSSSERIDRIATENYGMVRATSSDTVSVGGQATDAASGQAASPLS